VHKAYRFIKRIHTVVDTAYKLGRLVIMIPVVLHFIPVLADGLLKA